MVMGMAYLFFPTSAIIYLAKGVHINFDLVKKQPMMLTETDT